MSCTLYFGWSVAIKHKLRWSWQLWSGCSALHVGTYVACNLIGSGGGKVSHFHTLHFVMFLEAQPGPLLFLGDLQRLPPFSTASAALRRTVRFCCRVWLFDCESYWNRNQKHTFLCTELYTSTPVVTTTKDSTAWITCVSISNSLILGTWGFWLWVDWFCKNTFLPSSFAILINFLLPGFCFADPFHDQREYLEGSDN